jgi:hypothetical protein
MTMRIVGQVWNVCPRAAVPRMAVPIPASALVAAVKVQLFMAHLPVG